MIGTSTFAYLLVIMATRALNVQLAANKDCVLAYHHRFCLMRRRERKRNCKSITRRVNVTTLSSTQCPTFHNVSSLLRPAAAVRLDLKIPKIATWKVQNGRLVEPMEVIFRLRPDSASDSNSRRLEILFLRRSLCDTSASYNNKFKCPANIASLLYLSRLLYGPQLIIMNFPFTPQSVFYVISDCWYN